MLVRQSGVFWGNLDRCLSSCVIEKSTPAWVITKKAVPLEFCYCFPFYRWEVGLRKGQKISTQGTRTQMLHVSPSLKSLSWTGLWNWVACSYCLNSPWPHERMTWRLDRSVWTQSRDSKVGTRESSRTTEHLLLWAGGSSGVVFVSSLCSIWT